MKLKFFRLILLVVSALVIGSCKKQESDDNPPTEHKDYTLSSDVVIIGDEWENFVGKEVTDSVIALATTQGLNMPKTGDILLKTGAGEKFPYGFLGRVTDIKQAGNVTQIITQSVALDEVFEELSVHFSENISEYAGQAYNAVNHPVSFKKVRAENTPQTKSEIDEVFLELPLTLVDEVISVKGKLRVAINFDFDLKIQNRTLSYLNAAINPKFEVSADFAMSVKSKAKSEVELASIPFSAIPAGPLIIAPKVKIMAVAGAEGKVELQTRLAYDQSASYGVKYQDGSFSPYMESASDNPFKTEIIFSLDGKMYSGVRFALLCSFYGTNTGIGIGVTPKMAANAHFEINIDKFADGEFYNTFKQAMLKTNILLDGDVYVMAKIFGKTLAKYELYTPEYEVAVIAEKYLLPHFSVPTKDRVSETSVTLSYTAPNELFFPAGVGMAVYNRASGALVSRQYHVTAHSEASDFSYSYTFTGLDSKKKYSATPLVKFDAFPEITAAPKLDFSLKDDDDDSDAGEWVEINGVKWATRNVGEPGTFVENPGDYGGYYQWNRGTTDFVDAYEYEERKYGIGDIWLPENDPSPAGFRVPTIVEFYSLLDSLKVISEWIRQDDVTKNGQKFTDIATKASIFMPAAGNKNRYDGSWGWVSSTGSGHYWSRNADYDKNAYELFFYRDSINVGINYKDFSQSIRSVKE